MKRLNIESKDQVTTITGREIIKYYHTNVGVHKYYDIKISNDIDKNRLYSTHLETEIEMVRFVVEGSTKLTVRPD